MEIGNYSPISSVDNILDLSATGKKYSSVQSDAMRSGDTVDISEDAKKLYSEMIHKYDSSANNTVNEETGGENGDAGNGSGASGGAGGAGGSESSDNTETIKKQIESLKSQMSALASQMSGGRADAAVMGKINALQAQIAALEAQLNQAA